MNKKICTFLILVLACLFISGCVDSSKEQRIVVYDYADDSEKEYDSSNIEINEFINDTFDYLMDKGNTLKEIPKEASPYKKITLYEKVNNAEDLVMNIELYCDEESFYCNADIGSEDPTHYKVELSEGLINSIVSIWE